MTLGRATQAHCFTCDDCPEAESVFHLRVWGAGSLKFGTQGEFEILWVPAAKPAASVIWGVPIRKSPLPPLDLRQASMRHNAAIKFFKPPHVKSARYHVMKKAGMFNLGAATNQTLADQTLRVLTDASPEPMTLSERVQALFEQLHIPVFRYVMRKTRDSGRAEEITQETFLRLFRYLKDERSVDNPKAWLFTVANNLAIDAGRGDSRIQDLDETTWNRIEDTRLGAADPEKLAMQRERMDRLRLVVLNLTALQRDCLHLRAEGLRYREIAELMNISISTVADAVRRAALKLSREFDNGVSS